MDIPEKAVNKDIQVHLVTRFSHSFFFFPSESQLDFLEYVNSKLNVLKGDLSVSQILPFMVTMPIAILDLKVYSEQDLNLNSY